MPMDDIRITNTPYDDVFRTLLNDCSPLVIPVINEVFREHYTGQEEVIFSPNEHFMNRQGGNEDERKCSYGDPASFCRIIFEVSCINA